MTATYLISAPRTEADHFPVRTDTSGVVAVPAGRQSVGVGSLAAAEEMLDWLENNGYAERELVILGESAFEVRWR
jgi:hypothetical protein